MTDFSAIAGWAAILAAIATVVGAVTLALFFSKGQPWGTRNDIASIVLMLATVPVAIAIAILHGLAFPLAIVALAIGLVGMLGAAVTQGMLVVGFRTYQQLLPWTLGLGAVVGAWYFLIGVLGPGAPLRGGLDVLAMVSGLSYVALAAGFWRGGERNPIAITGGVTLLVASTWFLGWLGLRLVTGDIAIGTIT